MHEIIRSPEDVLAFTMTGTISGEDLDTVMDLSDAIMAKHEKVNMFIELCGITGLQLSALPHHVSRSLPLLGKLDRFGRIAVVADQAWMRAATRLESAMFPNMSYRVYEPEERGEALAWATGEKVPADQAA